MLDRKPQTISRLFYSTILLMFVFFKGVSYAATISQIITPKPNTGLASTSVTFKWTNVGSPQYSLSIWKNFITTGNLLYNKSQGTNTSVSLKDLPKNGENLIVRLYTRIGNVWDYNDSKYIAKGGSFYQYYELSFYDDKQNHTGYGEYSILNQNDNRTVEKGNLRNSCGPMSLLIVHNHYSKHDSLFTDTRKGVVDAITRLYSYAGKTKDEYFDSAYLVDGSTGGDFRKVINKWGWKYLKVRSSTNFPTFEKSYTQLITDVNAGRLAVVNVQGGPLSPDPNYEHFLVVYEANSSLIRVANPWDGKTKVIYKSDLDTKNDNKGWVKTFISIVISRCPKITFTYVV